MLIIRSQQEARMKEGPRTAFLERVEKHVVAEHPTFTSALPPGELRQFVERNWEMARGFGLRSERGLCLYLEAVCHFGEDFSTVLDWAGALLRGASFEDQKLGQLRERVEAARAKAHNSGGGNGARAATQ